MAKLEKRLEVYRSKLVRVKQRSKQQEKRVEINYDESLLSELNKLRDELKEGKQSMQCLQHELDQSEARVVKLQRDVTPTRKDGKKKRNHTFIQVRNSTTQRMTRTTTREVCLCQHLCKLFVRSHPG